MKKLMDFSSMDFRIATQFDARLFLYKWRIWRIAGFEVKNTIMDYLKRIMDQHWLHIAFAKTNLKVCPSPEINP